VVHLRFDETAACASAPGFRCRWILFMPRGLTAKGLPRNNNSNYYYYYYYYYHVSFARAKRRRVPKYHRILGLPPPMLFWSLS
jgi:hypothetical protein